MTVLTGEISTVDHVSSPSERALQDGQTSEFVAHRTAMKSSCKDECDGVVCVLWGVVCMEKIDADFAVVAIAHRSPSSPASLEAISHVNEVIHGPLCSYRGGLCGSSGCF